jgi:hypothetical protein
MRKILNCRPWDAEDATTRTGDIEAAVLIAVQARYAENLELSITRYWPTGESTTQVRDAEDLVAITAMHG